MISIQEEIDFCQRQIAWHIKQNEWCENQILWCSSELVRTRREDKELRAHAVESGIGDPGMWAKYVGDETKNLLSIRRKNQREIKSNNVWIAKFQKHIDELNKERERWGER